MGIRIRMHHPAIKAHRRHILAPSRPSPLFLAAARKVAPFYLRHLLHFDRIVLHEPERLIRAFRQFQQKETRLMLAFRHPYGDEPQLVTHVIDCLLPRMARKSGMPFDHRPHVRLVHGYEVALWSGAFIRFVLPRTGAVPIHHLQADPAGMKQIRDILLNDPAPLALAPEGQVSYRSGTVPRLEPGTARMGFWCAKDLEKAGRKEQAVILPVSVHAAYRKGDIRRLLRLIGEMEAACGLSAPEDFPSHAKPHASGSPDAVIPPAFRQALRMRLLRVETALLRLAEAHYQLTPVLEPFVGTEASGIQTHMPTEADLRQSRWDAVMEAALKAGEAMLDLPPHSLPAVADTESVRLDTRVARVYRIRREGWNRIYPMQVEGSALQRILNHRQAGEAWHAMRHMELVDILEYLDVGYLDGEGLPDGPSWDRLCETAMNLHDLTNRLAGGNFASRANCLRKTAHLLVGDPINLSDRLADYRKDMRGTTRATTEHLRAAFLALIDSWHHISFAETAGTANSVVKRK